MTVPHGEHDWLSADYVEGWISHDVTRDAERRPKLRHAASLLPFDRDRAISVLDIGGGYGEFTRQVLDVFPHASVVLHDFSEPMIKAAQDRLRGYEGRVDYRLADLGQPGWSRDLGGPFDAAVSAIAIHNLRQPAIIRAVYLEVAALLRPGGVFFNLDYVFPRSPGLVDLYGRQGGGWGSGHDGGHDRHGEGGGGRHSGPDEEPVTLADHLSWLAEGFSEADCLWKDLRETLFCGIRAR